MSSPVASVGLGWVFGSLFVVVGALVILFDALIVVAVVGTALVLAVAWRPMIGVVLLLGSTPLLVGLHRGSVVPYLRLNEALLFAVAGGLIVHAVVQWRRGHRLTLPGGAASTDWVVAALALAGSPLPLLVRFGRGNEVSIDDLTHAFIFVKLALLYLVFRYSVRTTANVRRCLIVSMVATVPVAFLAVGQSMQLPGVVDLLRPWLDQPPEWYAGRGAATIGNSGALGDVMALHLAMALGLYLRLRSDRSDGGSRSMAERDLYLLAAVVVFGVGALGSGQFSGAIAALVSVVVVSINAKRAPILFALPVGAAVGAIGLWPVISRRLEGFSSPSGLPPSWQGRIDNVTELFLPVLRSDFNWVFGVRPDTSIDDDRVAIGETFIESGLLWLLWAGGLLLLGAFVVTIVVGFRRFLAASRADDPWIGAVGAAGLAATTFIAILSIVDPHLTLRGISDVYFPLLALSLLATSPSSPPVEAEDQPRTPPDTEPDLRLGSRRYSLVGSVFKRLLDVAVSAILLVVLSPVLLVIGAAVRRGSPGPALFRQLRVGYAERPFTILKFRTMQADNDDAAHRAFVQAMLRDEITTERPEGSDAAFKLVDDPRVTRLGAWLRRTSLDELPQLVNVLRGQMSLVGPRPSLHYELADYLPRHRLRATAVPGMTGLWQIQGRSDLHMTEALDLDLDYVRTCSVWTDVVILVKTARVLAKNTGV